MPQQASVAITLLLAKEVDKIAKIFGNYDVMKSKIQMELKTTSILKKKDNLVRKLKVKFGEGASEQEENEEEDEEEEQEQAQEPLILAQGMGEDKEEEEEGAKEEETKEIPIQA